LAIEPTGTLVVYPPLTDGQYDSLIQRLEARWGEGLDLTVGQMGQILWAIFPELFAGDEELAQLEAERIIEESDGVRPMPNGHRPKPKPAEPG
jgi:hypothetical protein